MALRWVVRTDASSKKRDETAHLVQNAIRGMPALCGELLKKLEFWDPAERKTVVCTYCKAYRGRR